MSGCLIILRSVTYAQRAKRALEKMGISAYVIKPEASLIGNGCGFAIKVSEGYLAETIDVLKKQNYEIGKVFLREKDGYRELSV